MIDLGTISILNQSSPLEARKKVTNLAISLGFSHIQSIRLGVATSEIARAMSCHEQRLGVIKLSIQTGTDSGLELIFTSDDPDFRFQREYPDFFDRSTTTKNTYTAFKNITNKVDLTQSFIQEQKRMVMRRSRDQLLLDVKIKNQELRATNLSLQKFVPQDFLKFLEKDSIVEFQLGDALEKNFTILFSDMRSFSSHAEGLNPSELFSFVNEFLEVIVPVIHKHRGFVITYLGDAVMAAFPEQTMDALHCSMEMYQAVSKLNLKRQTKSQKLVAIGVGINYGGAMMGIIGQDDRLEPAIMSDTVNLAARLESLTKRYNAKTAFSESALHQIESHGKAREELNYRLLDHVRVVGKSKPVKIYELLFPASDHQVSLNIDQTEQYELAIQKYFERNIIDAYKILSHLRVSNPDDVALKNYMERCIPMLEFDQAGHPISQSVPEDFDPVHSLRSK